MEQVNLLLGIWGLMLLPWESSHGSKAPFLRLQQGHDPFCLVGCP